MKYKLHYCRDIITRNTKNKLLLQDYAFKKNFHTILWPSFFIFTDLFFDHKLVTLHHQFKLVPKGLEGAERVHSPACY